MTRPFEIAVVPVTPFQQNCAILWDRITKRAIVCDPGGDVPRIQASITQAGLQVEAIVLTHGHLDHAGGAADLRDALSVPIIGPDQRDRFLLEGLQQQGELFGMPGLRNVTPDRWVQDGDALQLAGYTFRVLHCPGHTPGHVIFVHQANDFALVGDVLFHGSVGRTDFPYGDSVQLLTSIRKKLLLLPDDLAFLCGHGSASTIGIERRSNPFLQN